MQATDFINKTFDFKLGNLNISPTYWQVAAILILLFLLILALARMRYLFVSWSLGKSGIAMLFWGFVLTIIVEGFFLIGGRTLFTEILGWENAPKPISTALDMGRERLVEVLGVTEEVSMSHATEKTSVQEVILKIQSLSPSDTEKVRSVICKP